jgi:OOP family OmpA-OmpF porin
MPIQFEYNSASVKPEYEAHIARMAEYLQSEPAINLVIVGHTDATGSGAYNQRLSERRAAAVLGALQRYGVSGSRLRAEGHGETQPRVSNPYAGENRRVEFLNFN